MSGNKMEDFDYIVNIFDEVLDRELEVRANLKADAVYSDDDQFFLVHQDPVFCDYTVYDFETGSIYDMPVAWKNKVDLHLENVYWDRLSNGC